MLHDIDTTLRRLLTDELARTPGCPVYHPDQITFDPPAIAEAVQDGEAHVNLYLHDVRENVLLRDESFRRVGKPEDGVMGRRRAVVKLDLSYLVTVYARDEAHLEHRLLTDVLGVLLRNLAIPAQYLGGMLAGRTSNDVLLSCAQPDHPGYTDPPGLWQALGGRMRPALGLMVTGPFDPFETQWTRVVREAVLGLGPTPGAQGSGSSETLARANRGLGEASFAPSRIARVCAAGIVLDRRTETPLAQVRVRTGNGEEEALTDARGFFHLGQLPPGPATLHVSRRGYEAQQITVSVPAEGRPDLLVPQVIALMPLSDQDWAAQEAGVGRDAAPLDLFRNEPTQTVTVSGRLRFRDGKPAPRIAVRLGRRRTFTSDEGFYAFADVSPDEAHGLIAEMPGVGEVPLDRVPPEKT